MTVGRTSPTIYVYLVFLFVSVAIVGQNPPARSAGFEPIQEKRMSLSRSSTAQSFYPELQKYLQDAEIGFNNIPTERQDDLERIASYMCERLSKSEPAQLIFICTHNSRRSHLTQVWAQIAADFYGIDGVETYSGGTEATAFNPRTVAALQRSGLNIKTQDKTASNPKYEVLVSDSAAPQLCFSKVYDAPPNPTKEFCAVMTCSDADDACPIVAGCDLRMPLRYDDPKIADDTEFETQRYDERSKQICVEMLYMMSQLKAKLDSTSK